MIMSDSRWKLNDIPVVAIENDLLRIITLPDAGGKIWSIYHKVWNQELLWHNPRIEPACCSVGDSYDDTWAGGWDELFPNDIPEHYAGETYADHGELWNGKWSAEVIEDEGNKSVSVKLVKNCPITPARFSKNIRLVENEAKVRVRYRIENLSDRELRFLFKLHPALRMEPGWKIEIPAKRMKVGEGSELRKSDVREYAWPYLPGETGDVDMRDVLPKSSRVTEFQYGTGLTDGWCALVDPNLKRGFGFTFDQEIFTSVWTFTVYGGWRDLYTIVLEPCTGYPYTLSEAVAGGKYSVLGPGETLETEVIAVAFEDGYPLRGIDRFGQILR